MKKQCMTAPCPIGQTQDTDIPHTNFVLFYSHLSGVRAEGETHTCRRIKVFPKRISQRETIYLIATYWMG